MPSKISSLFTARVQKLEKSKLFKRFGKKTWWGIALVLVLAIGGGVAYFQVNTGETETTETQTLQTTVARTGDLTLYASGTGTLIAVREVDLRFTADGEVKEINVEVGDKVKAGDVLARIDDTDAQIKYKQAKRDLLESTSAAAVATAEEAVATAETDLITAINKLSYLISSEVYYWEVKVAETDTAIHEAKAALETSPNNAEQKEKLEKAEAYMEYAEERLKDAWWYYDHDYVKDKFVAWDSESGKKTYSPPNDAEIAEARAGLTVAKATLQEAKYLYAALTGGEVPEDATGSGLTELEQTKLNLEAAQVTLDGTALITPIDGTVMSIDIIVGDYPEDNSSMTIADLSKKYLEVFLDESDWENVKVGYPAEVVFDILPDSTFKATVIQVDPGLYSESGTSAVRAIVQIDEVDEDSFNFPLGTSAAADVIAGDATDAILIPVEALHDAGNGQYGVFVMTNGEPRLQLVEVGIQDLTTAAIISGLNPGDVVTTGIAETQ
ncbi:MAG: efflux RND transporter periplasmic adaptor subunit [Chloroflexi bacterium]|nr:efflux RND transporter periplasmic adaptor subunit [Chloroflexota bacterium]